MATWTDGRHSSLGVYALLETEGLGKEKQVMRSLGVACTFIRLSIIRMQGDPK